jgi:phosphoribosylformylglycinamidine synthase
MLYVIGMTRDELGGSHYHKFSCPRVDADSSDSPEARSGQVPQLDPQAARKAYAAMHRAIDAGLVRACHDLSEGGLAVAAAEMAFAGGFGAEIDLATVPCEGNLDAAVRLFSESNTRFLCEVRTENAAAFEAAIAGAAHARVGQVTDSDRFVIRAGDATVVESNLAALKEAWQKPLRWQ